jgi:hypothetical protein
MAYTRNLFVLIFVIVLIISGCTPQSATLPPAATQTSLPSPTIIPSATQTIEPTLQPTTQPSPEIPSTPISSNLYLPNGIAALTTSGGKVTYYDLLGKPIAELQDANMGMRPYRQAIVAGSYAGSPNPSVPPLVYYVFENGGELWKNADNNVSLLKSAPNLLNLINAPGTEILSYNLLEYSDAGLKSRVYLTDLQALPTAEPIFETTNSQSTAIQPLAIALEADQPVGLWYTNIPYGIGGNIVFEPRQSLAYLDLTNFQMKTYLDTTKAPVGISDDQAWFAYTPVGSVGPLSIIKNFDSSTLLSVPLKEESNRGAGNAVFSPDDHYIAWKEASDTGSSGTGLAQQTIRIASIDGTLISEIPDASLAEVSGIPEVGWVVPVGWLDTQTLALEVSDSTGDHASIVTVKFDGTGLALLTPGKFVGFLYP